MRDAGSYLSLFTAVLVGTPVGSFYAWSVFFFPLSAARPQWSNASVRAMGFVIAALGVACGYSGKVLANKLLPLREFSLLGVLLSGAGLVGCAQSVEHSLEVVFYVSACVHGIGLGQCYVSFIVCVKSWWGQSNPGFAAGYVMMVSSSGSFLFAWINYALLSYFHDDGDPVRGPVHAFYAFAMICAGSQLVGSLLFTLPPPPPRSAAAAVPLATSAIVTSFHYWALFFLWFVCLAPMLGILSVMSPFLQSHFGVDAAQGATWLAAVNIVGTLFRQVVGLVAGAVGAKRLFAGSVALTSLLFAILPSIGTTKMFAPFILCLFLAKICYGASFTLINMYSNIIFGADGGQVYSLLIMSLVAAGSHARSACLYLPLLPLLPFVCSVCCCLNANEAHTALGNLAARHDLHSTAPLYFNNPPPTMSAPSTVVQIPTRTNSRILVMCLFPPLLLLLTPPT